MCVRYSSGIRKRGLRAITYIQNVLHGISQKVVVVYLRPSLPLSLGRQGNSARGLHYCDTVTESRKVHGTKHVLRTTIAETRCRTRIGRGRISGPKVGFKDRARCLPLKACRGLGVILCDSSLKGMTFTQLPDRRNHHEILCKAAGFPNLLPPESHQPTA